MMSPTYRYECSNCEHKELKHLPITQAPKLMICPQCNQHTLHKLVGTGILFDLKGEGFYKNGIT